MARVWFVRRRGAQWIVPGGAPACERSLAELVFPLDLGTHRRLSDEEAPVPDPSIPAETPFELLRVVVETTPEDLAQHPFSGYTAGYYDSPYSPREAARRVGLVPSERAA